MIFLAEDLLFSQTSDARKHPGCLWLWRCLKFSAWNGDISRQDPNKPEKKQFCAWCVNYVLVI